MQSPVTKAGLLAGKCNQSFTEQSVITPCLVPEHCPLYRYRISLYRSSLRSVLRRRANRHRNRVGHQRSISPVPPPRLSQLARCLAASTSLLALLFWKAIGASRSTHRPFASSHKSVDSWEPSLRNTGPAQARQKPLPTLSFVQRLVHENIEQTLEIGLITALTQL